MPVKEREQFLKETRPIPLDDINQPNGGQIEPNFDLNNTYIDFQIQSPISPLGEAQKGHVEDKSQLHFNADHSEHLKLVENTQREFNASLGIIQERGIRSYNPVFDIVNFRLASNEKEREAVKLTILKNHETNLRERYHTPVSVVNYILDENGVAYTENSNTPADYIFDRGAKERIKQGSDPEREWAYVEGGAKAKKEVAKGTIGSMAIVICPPEETQGSIYTDNFVDIYKSSIDPGTNRKIITMTRFASSLSNAEYENKATMLQKGYFDQKNTPLDIHFLKNPILIDKSDARTSQELFGDEFAYQEKVTLEDHFKEIYNQSLDFIKNYIEVVEAGDYREIALAFNAILNKADNVRQQILDKGKGFIKKVSGKAFQAFRSVKEAVSYWGKKAVAAVMAGCGLSGGFSFGGRGLSLTRGGRMDSLFTKEGGYCPRCKIENTCTKKCYKCDGRLV